MELETNVEQRHILGIRGAMGAGKDTLGLLICKAHREYSVWKFATVLREALSIITDIPAERTVSQDDKRHDLSAQSYSELGLLLRIRKAIMYVTGAVSISNKYGEISFEMFRILTGGEYAASADVHIPMTVGRALQILGTECFRELVGGDVWVRALFRRWVQEGKPSIVITDVRFREEVDAIYSATSEAGAKGIILEVRRETDTAAVADGRSMAHASERGLEKVKADYTFDNDGTIDELGQKLDAAWPLFAKLRG
jgi:hypothetical protein